MMESSGTSNWALVSMQHRKNTSISSPSQWQAYREWPISQMILSCTVAHTEECDRNLDRVLERLSEKQLTVNAEKCTFRMNKVVLMGILLTKHGIGPTEEKVRAVVEASQPQTPSEVRSFLRLIGFSARFLPDFFTRLQEKENHSLGAKSNRNHFTNWRIKLQVHQSWHILTRMLEHVLLPMPVQWDLEQCLCKSRRTERAVPFVVLVAVWVKWSAVIVKLRGKH